MFIAGSGPRAQGIGSGFSSSLRRGHPQQSSHCLQTPPSIKYHELSVLSR